MDRRSSLPGRTAMAESPSGSSSRGVLRQFRPGISEQWLSGDTRNTNRGNGRRSATGVLRDSRRASTAAGVGIAGRPPLPPGATPISRPQASSSGSDRRMICPECLASFDSATVFESHLARRHGDADGQGVLSCPHCSEAIKHRTNLHRHIRVKHDERTGRHHCRKCGFTCNSETDLDRHKEQHRACPFCNVVMESGTGLAKHMQNCRNRFTPRQ